MLSPLAFVLEQANMLLIFFAPLWIGGLAWLSFASSARKWRFAAPTFLVFLATMMVLHAKDYYVAPIYPVLFAAGAVALGRIFSSTTGRPSLIRRFSLFSFASLLLAVRCSPRP